ncbi:hypothetical protein GCM10010978_32480 [Compostibacillus humi]|uniref:Heparin-sulfate lyase N-terminal domain-containing protein n=1 Tax=Compostibacillus humi TaxID=1245525 RepID=A0A8J2TS01_9BACI|nr:heparinase II/III family protein [Compostibacillus humi]GFZ91333.1 hypothetical protein GCM10010978_32480 [Compostibacillus humi]
MFSKPYLRKKDILLFNKENTSEINKYKNIDKDATFEKISPFLITYSKNPSLSAKDVVNNEIHIKGYKKLNISEKIYWNGENSEPRSFFRILHGHYFINDLVDAYRIEKNAKYISKGFEIIKDWIINNPFENPKNEMAWHDETTSKRLKTWVNFFDAAKDPSSTVAR